MLGTPPAIAEGILTIDQYKKQIRDRINVLRTFIDATEKRYVQIEDIIKDAQRRGLSHETIEDMNARFAEISNIPKHIRDQRNNIKRYLKIRSSDINELSLILFSINSSIERLMTTESSNLDTVRTFILGLMSKRPIGELGLAEPLPPGTGAVGFQRAIETADALATSATEAKASANEAAAAVEAAKIAADLAAGRVVEATHIKTLTDTTAQEAAEAAKAAEAAARAVGAAAPTEPVVKGVGATGVEGSEVGSTALPPELVPQGPGTVGKGGAEEGTEGKRGGTSISRTVWIILAVVLGLFMVFVLLVIGAGIIILPIMLIPVIAAAIWIQPSTMMDELSSVTNMNEWIKWIRTWRHSLVMPPTFDTSAVSLGSNPEACDVWSIYRSQILDKGVAVSNLTISQLLSLPAVRSIEQQCALRLEYLTSTPSIMASRRKLVEEGTIRGKKRSRASKIFK